MAGVSVMAITPGVPAAPDSSWATPAASVPPVVGSLPREQAVAGTSPVAFPGDADPGGRDTVAASVAEAVANTEARYHELAGDTYGAGSTIGDVMDLPGVVSDMSKHTGSPNSPDSGAAG
jgi:hypothetical protein